jgi:orotidine-5'-phosphate decarboxylase
LDAQGNGLLISASRSIIFGEDPAEAARALRDEINAAREAAHAAS